MLSAIYSCNILSIYQSRVENKQLQTIYGIESFIKTKKTLVRRDFPHHNNDIMLYVSNTHKTQAYHRLLFVCFSTQKSPTKKFIASQQLVRPLSQMLGQTTTSKERPTARAQELHIRAKSQINKEMRKELLENGNRT